MKRYADLISGGLLALVGIILLVESRNIRAMMEMEFGPKIMPQIYSVALIGLGAAIAVSSLVRARKGAFPSGKWQHSTIGRFRVVATMGLVVFYVAALRPLGFLATSIVYLFFQFLVLGGAANKWRLLPYLIVAVAVSLGIYHLFYGVFNVFLPVGRIW